MSASSFLSSFNQSELLANEGKIVTITQDSSADAALKTLMTHKILSAPCVDNKGHVTGLLDMADFCETILKLVPSSAPTSDNSLRSSIATSNLFSSVSASNVNQVACHDKLQTAPASASLHDLVKHLASRKHRVVITRDDKTVANIITQSAVLTFVANHVQKLGGVAERSVADLGLGKQGAGKLVSLSPTDSAAEGFRRMIKHGISAVPVLHAEGHLMGNLSVSDLKGIGSWYEVGHLTLPVMQFLQQAHAQDVEIKSPTIVCHPHSPLSEVIRRMSAARIHRIYVVDDNEKVTGVITLTDVMRTLIEN